MMIIPGQPETANGNLYFTLKYVAGYGGRGNMDYRVQSEAIYAPPDVDTRAERSIDAILKPALPELELWRERQRIEAKLLGASRPYTPFF